MSQNFAYKAGFLQPVDWRPREFNKAADLVADHVLDQRSNVCFFDLHSVRRRLGEFMALQFFCDGGHGHGVGSMAFVIVGWRSGESGIQREILAYEGIYVEISKSAFGSELGALDLATQAAEQLAEWGARKRNEIPVNTKRRKVQ